MSINLLKSRFALAFSRLKTKFVSSMITPTNAFDSLSLHVLASRGGLVSPRAEWLLRCSVGLSSVFLLGRSVCFLLGLLGLFLLCLKILCVH